MKMSRKLCPTRKINIFVKSSEICDSLEVEEVITVNELKEKIGKKFHFEIRTIFIVFRGSVLKNNDTLVDNQIKDGSVIWIHIKTRCHTAKDAGSGAQPLAQDDKNIIDGEGPGTRASRAQSPLHYQELQNLAENMMHNSQLFESIVLALCSSTESVLQAFAADPHKAEQEVCINPEYEKNQALKENIEIVQQMLKDAKSLRSSPEALVAVLLSQVLCNISSSPLSLGDIYNLTAFNGGLTSSSAAMTSETDAVKCPSCSSAMSDSKKAVHMKQEKLSRHKAGVQNMKKKKKKKKKKKNIYKQETIKPEKQKSEACEKLVMKFLQAIKTTSRKDDSEHVQASGSSRPTGIRNDALEKACSEVIQTLTVKEAYRKKKMNLLEVQSDSQEERVTKTEKDEAEEEIPDDEDLNKLDFMTHSEKKSCPNVKVLNRNNLTNKASPSDRGPKNKNPSEFKGAQAGKLKRKRYGNESISLKKKIKLNNKHTGTGTAPLSTAQFSVFGTPPNQLNRMASSPLDFGSDSFESTTKSTVVSEEHKNESFKQPTSQFSSSQQDQRTAVGMHFLLDTNVYLNHLDEIMEEILSVPLEPLQSKILIPHQVYLEIEGLRRAKGSSKYSRTVAKNAKISMKKLRLKLDGEHPNVELESFAQYLKIRKELFPVVMHDEIIMATGIKKRNAGKPTLMVTDDLPFNTKANQNDLPSFTSKEIRLVMKMALGSSNLIEAIKKACREMTKTKGDGNKKIYVMKGQSASEEERKTKYKDEAEEEEIPDDEDMKELDPITHLEIESGPNTKGPGLTGIINPRNSCFINSVLQCLSNTPPLTKYFVDKSFQGDINPFSQTEGEVAEKLAAVLIGLWKANFKYISCRDLKIVVGKKKKQFRGYEQQDSQEFFHFLLNCLRDDLNKLSSNSEYPCLNLSPIEPTDFDMLSLPPQTRPLQPDSYADQLRLCAQQQQHPHQTNQQGFSPPGMVKDFSSESNFMSGSPLSLYTSTSTPQQSAQGLPNTGQIMYGQGLPNDQQMFNYEQMSSNTNKLSLSESSSTEAINSMTGFPVSNQAQVSSLDKLKKEPNKATVNSPGKELPSSDLTPGDKAWEDFNNAHNSVIDKLFYGQLQSAVTCMTCDEKSLTFETFSDLSVPIPTTSQNCCVTDCLNMYMEGEVISGWYCSNCKEKRDAIKKFDIWRLPSILVIHLKRFYREGRWKKRLSYVDFPFQMHMEPFTVPNQQDKNYDLYAVANHYGSMEGGHYTAYCKNKPFNKWFQFDDHKVSKISQSDVQSAAAYMLFYKSTNDNLSHEVDDHQFDFTSNESVLKNTDGEKVILSKKFDDGRANMTETTQENLKKFVFSQFFPMVDEFNHDTANKIIGGEMGSYLILFLSKAEGHIDNYLDGAIDVAKDFKDQVFFTYINTDDEEHERILEFFGMKKEEIPAMRLIRLEELEKYKPGSPELSAENIRSFVQDFVDGKLKQHLLSQDLAEDWDKNPVKVLVASMFDEMVLKKEKDVLVLFYSPWCGHCKQLAPIYDQLGEKFQNSDTIVVAKMDATVNELEHTKITSFPTLKLYTKGESNIIDYKGERTLEGLTKFLENGGDYGMAAPDESEEEDEDDDLPRKDEL